MTAKAMKHVANEADLTLSGGSAATRSRARQLHELDHTGLRVAVTMQVTCSASAASRRCFT